MNEFARAVGTVSTWIIPIAVAFIPLFGFIKGVKVYETFAEGAKDGLVTVVRILPFLIGMLMAVSVFRESGALDLLGIALGPVLRPVGLSPEILTLAFLRPISGTGSLGAAAEIMRAHGPDSFLGRLASAMQGSCDTTFYILTVYFGSVGIKKVRHSVAVGLLADLVGFAAAVVATRLVFP